MNKKSWYKIMILGGLTTIVSSCCLPIILSSCSNNKQENNNNNNEKPKPPVPIPNVKTIMIDQTTINQIQNNVIKQLSKLNLYQIKQYLVDNLNELLLLFNNQLTNKEITWYFENNSLTIELITNKYIFKNDNIDSSNINIDKTRLMFNEISINDQIPSKYIIENNDQLINDFRTNIQTNLNDLKPLLNDVVHNYDQASLKFATIIHNILNLCYFENISTYDLSDLKINLNTINYLMINIQTKYNYLFDNFSLYDNLIFNFDQQNLLTTLTIKNKVPEFNSYQYKIVLSQFVFNGLKNITSKMTNLEKLIIISDYVCRFLNYYPNGETSMTLYESLITRIGVCRHYVELLSILLNCLGIENYIEIGNLYAASIAGGYHTWNMVKINNQWLAVDLTNADYFNTTFKPMNSSGPSLFFNDYFLKGKNDNHHWQTHNTTIIKTPYFDKDIVNSNNLDQYINTNSTFLYQNYWSDKSLNFYLNQINKNNLGKVVYFNNGWYVLINNVTSKMYELIKFNPNDNTHEVLWNVSNKFAINLLSTISYNNLYFFLVQQKNNILLSYLDLNHIDQGLNHFNTTMPLLFTDEFYIENNNLYSSNKKVVIKNVPISIPACSQTSSIDPQIETVIYSSLGKVWQSNTLTGKLYGQILNKNVNVIDSKQSLMEYIKKINTNGVQYYFGQDLPNTIPFNPTLFLQDLQSKFGYFKLNINVQTNLISNNYEIPKLEYQWYKNEELFKTQENAFLIFDNINNLQDIQQQIYGKWYCKVVDAVTKQVYLTSNTVNIIESNENLFYPYFLNLIDYHNINQNLDITSNDFGNSLVSNTIINYQIFKDNYLIQSKDINSQNQKINYSKNQINLINSDYGIYTVVVNVIDSNTNAKVSWTAKYIFYHLTIN